MTNQIFNPKQVRDKFRSHYCKELTMPSGKMSGHYLFPISDEEVIELTRDLKFYERPKGFLTGSEWALWTALRRKYGFNYMKPIIKQQRFISNPYNFIEKEETPAIDALEERLFNYCNCKLGEILEIVQKKAPSPEPERSAEKNEKNFRQSLDNDEIDVLY